MITKAYSVSFRAQTFSYPGGTIECFGANFVNVFLTPSHVAAGVTIDGQPGFAGLNEYKCPTPDGIISATMEIGIPSLMVQKLSVKSGFITSIS